MKTNWKKKLDEVNRKRFTIPAGWETRDQVAEQLECAPDRVDKLLKPGVDDGTFQKRMFSVWDEGRRMAVQVPCYQMTENQRSEDEDDALAVRIRASIANNPGHTDAMIAKNLKGIKAAKVKQIRESL